MTPTPTGPGSSPLAGFTVAVTAARRREEIAALLERRGARTLLAPALRIVPLETDDELHEATRRCVEGDLDVAVATTGIGFRGWIEAADGWGLGEELRRRMTGARVLARGPKARGAVRAAGLVDSWSPASESSAEVLDHLLAGDLRGRRVAVQLHGEPLPDFVQALRGAGADVVEVPVYRWAPPVDLEPVRRLLVSIADGAVDAVTFTSAPAAASLLRTAAAEGTQGELLAALRGDVLPVCVGPVTAAPLDRAGVASVAPARARVGDLVRCVAEELPRRRARPLQVAGQVLEVRGHAVLLDGHPLVLPAAQLAVLRMLAERPGRVRSRAELLGALPGGTRADEHAVEMTVSRLRRALGGGGGPDIVQTVVKRGYRLAANPVSGERMPA